MTDRDLRRYQRLVRVQTFGLNNAKDFPAASNTHAQFAIIDTAIAAIDKAKVGQTPDRVSKETLLDALTLDFKSIARTARAIESAGNQPRPGFASPYRVPDNPSEAAITTHADRLLEALEDTDDDTPEEKSAKAALRALFTPYDISPDFVAHLRADRDAIDDANNHNETENQDGVASTASIGPLLKRGGDAVFQLDATIQNKYSTQPDKLAAWLSAGRVERSPRRGNDDAPKPADPQNPPAPKT